MCFKEKLDKVVDTYNQKVKDKQTISNLEKEIIILKEKIKYFEDLKKLEHDRISNDLHDMRSI
jgi:hypothetical protein